MTTSSPPPSASASRAAARASGALRRVAGLLLAVLAVACDDWEEGARVPLIPVNAAFTLADAVWFEEEHTRFVFWRFEADQGLGPTSRVELGLQTATGVQAPQPVSSFTPVHRHVAVDCGVRGRCGSVALC